MKIAESRQIKLRTVTPVFCGNGETLDARGYVLDGQVIRVVNVERLLDGFNEQQSKSYQEWMNSILQRKARLDEQMRHARDRKDFASSGQLMRQRRELIDEFALDRFINNKLGQRANHFLLPYTAYLLRYNSRPDQSGFRTHTKDHHYRPYLPGSEIKGALRTALLYSLIEEPEGYQIYRDLLLRANEKAKEDAARKRGTDERALDREKAWQLRRMADELEAKLLRGESKGRVQNDAKYDSLRLLHVSDSNALAPEVMKIELTQSMGTNRNTKTWIEAVAKDTEFTVQLTLHAPDLVADKMGFNHLRDRFHLSRLLEACYIHSAAILEEDAEYFRGTASISRILDDLIRMNTPESPLLRIGAGQGFLSLTANLAILQNDSKLYEEMIRKGVSAKRGWKTVPNDFPKTQRLITEFSGTPTGILGWVKLTVDL